MRMATCHPEKKHSAIGLCRSCYNNYLYHTTKWRFRQYGITAEDFTAMAEEQNHVCAICSRSDKRLVVDHCHRTGSVRGLLCDKCNVTIGWLERVMDHPEFWRYIGSRGRVFA